jgi:hypothetical protein
MTLRQFRENAALTAALSSLLNDPVMRTALDILKESNQPIDPDPHLDPIASVRMLSQAVGFRTALDTLQLLSIPLIAPLEQVAEYKPEV